MRLAATGDVMLGRNVGALIPRLPREYVWGGTLPLLRAADAVIVNLECVIARGDTGERWPRKVFHFKAPPEAIGVLQAAGTRAVTLANNHTLDYGTAALVEMLRLLQEAGLPAAGAGRNFDEASHAVTLEAGGLRIALISFTDNEPSWEAGAEAPGVFYVPIDRGDRRAAALLNRVRAARRAHDLVIVAAHWGPNMMPEPPAHHPPFARALADAGADLIVGTSAHVVQGIELYRPPGRPGRAVPLCYDCGDYVDDYAVDAALRNDRAFLTVFDLDREGVRRIDLHPVLIDGLRGQVNPAGAVDADELMETMAGRCGQMGTAVTRSGDTLTVAVVR